MNVSLSNSMDICFPSPERTLFCQYNSVQSRALSPQSSIPKSLLGKWCLSFIFLSAHMYICYSLFFEEMRTELCFSAKQDWRTLLLCGTALKVPLVSQSPPGLCLFYQTKSSRYVFFSCHQLITSTLFNINHRGPSNVSFLKEPYENVYCYRWG